MQSIAGYLLTSERLIDNVYGGSTLAVSRYVLGSIGVSKMESLPIAYSMLHKSHPILANSLPSATESTTLNFFKHEMPHERNASTHRISTQKNNAPCTHLVSTYVFTPQNISIPHRKYGYRSSCIRIALALAYETAFSV